MFPHKLRVTLNNNDSPFNKLTLFRLTSGLSKIGNPPLFPYCDTNL